MFLYLVKGVAAGRGFLGGDWFLFVLQFSGREQVLRDRSLISLSSTGERDLGEQINKCSVLRFHSLEYLASTLQYV